MSIEATLAIIAIVIMAVIISVGAGLASYQCSARASMMKVESNWSLIQGCMIKVKGQWIPLENFRIFGGGAE